VPCALIGAAALAVHGISRSTFDIDLLVTDRGVLDDSLWISLPASVVREIRIEQLLARPDRDAVVAFVDRHVTRLPSNARHLGAHCATLDDSLSLVQMAICFQFLVR